MWSFLFAALFTGIQRYSSEILTFIATTYIHVHARDSLVCVLCPVPEARSVDRVSFFLFFWGRMARRASDLENAREIEALLAADVPSRRIVGSGTCIDAPHKLGE